MRFYVGRWYVSARLRPFRLRIHRIAPSSVKQVKKMRKEGLL